LLNECVLTKPAQGARHNRILRGIESHLRRYRFTWDVYREKRIYFIDENGDERYLIPDLLVVSPDSSTAMCLDVGVSYETWLNSLDNYDKAKRVKYGAIAGSIVEWLHEQGHAHINSVATHGLIFGSRASIHNVCLNILLDTFGMARNFISSMMIECAVDSHDIITTYRSWDSPIT